jgi:RNA polymerase subunit RPABC4/transcription elongation factor Spt4
MSLLSAYATPKKTFPKARKGDVVAIRHDITLTNAKTFKRTKQSYYKLAYATKVDRTGRVTEFQNVCSNWKEKVAANNWVCVISDPDRQAAARDLAASIKDNYFGDADAVKTAILDRIEALR